MLLEGDEMYTRFLYTYGKSLLNQKFGTKKVVKEKEFMKFIG